MTIELTDNMLCAQTAERCLNTLKRALKEKGFTYKQLAEAMAVSENTVKRMLNNTNISLNRLLFVADYCAVDLGELMEVSQRSSRSQHFFSDAQD